MTRQREGLILLAVFLVVPGKLRPLRIPSKSSRHSVISRSRTRSTSRSGARSQGIGQSCGTTRTGAPQIRSGSTFERLDRMDGLRPLSTCVSADPKDAPWPGAKRLLLSRLLVASRSVVGTESFATADSHTLLADTTPWAAPPPPSCNAGLTLSPLLQSAHRLKATNGSAAARTLR